MEKTVTRNLILILILSAMTNLTMAQTAESIILDHVKSLGDGVSQIENVRIQQKLYSNNMEGFQTTILIPNKFYWQETIIGGGQMITSVKEDKGWTFSSFVSSDVKPLNSKQCAVFMINSHIFGPLYEFYESQDGGAIQSVEFQRMDKRNNDDCYLLKVTFKLGGKSLVWVSKSTHMICETESNMGRMLYSDYKMVGNAMFPHKVEIINAQGRILGETTDIEINPSINIEKYFVKP